MKVRANGLTVLVPRFGIEGNILIYGKESNTDTPATVRNREKQLDLLVFDEKKHTLAHKEDDNARVRVFDEVRTVVHS